jgi:uncharacterized protein YbbK (DUF523 family)
VVESSSRERDDQGCLIVSACLLGVRCNHKGQANTNDTVVALRATHRIVAVCPESAGGLPTPRVEAQRLDDGTVRTIDGRDVTEWFARGAAHTVRVAEAVGATRAVLKARSPSCGSGGVTTEALRAAGLEVVSEDDL